MDINIKGDPGTGNTFQEIHIGTVQNFNPAATTVINHNYGPRPKPSPSDAGASANACNGQLRSDVMQYVMRLERCVASDWACRYATLWRDILDDPLVGPAVAEPGKQQGTTFNRNLVGSIIYIMCTQGILTERNASRLTTLLEGAREHSVRAYLGLYPAESDLRARVYDIIARH